MYSGCGFVEGLGAAERLRLPSFAFTGLLEGGEDDLVDSAGLGDASSTMDVLKVSGEEDSTRGLERADAAESLLESELAGDPGVDNFSAAKTRLKSACKLMVSGLWPYCWFPIGTS